MDLWDTLEARRTIRSFQDRPVEWPLIEKAIRAAVMAPSHNHLWNWGFILLRDRDFRRRLVDEGLRIQDIKDPVVLRQWVDGLPDEARRMYLRAVPVQRKMLMTAPEVIVAVYETKKNEAAPRYPSDLNAHAAIWMAIAYLLLSLAEDGLYSCTLPPDDTARAREMLGLPSGWEVAALLPVGYPGVFTKKSGHPSSVDGFIHIDRFNVNRLAGS